VTLTPYNIYTGNGRPRKH